MTVSMSTLVSLEYPNGRTHLTEVPQDIEADAEFELFGRRWRAVGPVPVQYAYRYVNRPQPRLLCRQAG